MMQSLFGARCGRAMVTTTAAAAVCELLLLFSCIASPIFFFLVLMIGKECREREILYTTCILSPNVPSEFWDLKDKEIGEGVRGGIF